MKEFQAFSMVSMIIAFMISNTVTFSEKPIEQINSLIPTNLMISIIIVLLSLPAILFFWWDSNNGYYKKIIRVAVIALKITWM